MIVVGGGMAGATAAKYLRLCGDTVDVTLVDRSAAYTSCIMSSLVLTGQRSLASLDYTHAALRDRYGVRTVYQEVQEIDPVAGSVRLASGTRLTADRIVLAPGIAFDGTEGLTQGKVIVLDANPDFVTERDNFSQAFFGLHGQVIEYRTNVVTSHVDQPSKTLFANTGAVRADVVNLIPAQRAPELLRAAGLLNDPGGRFAKVNVLDYSSTAAPAKVHVIGDASATTQPKATHIANQEAKVLADALSRIFQGGKPDPAPVTNSACFSTITMNQASWLHALFQYDASSGNMVAMPSASGASLGWNSDHFNDMGTWCNALMADTFA